MKPFAALNAGVAAMTKPAVVKTTAIVRNPKARLAKERLGGFDSEVASSRRLVDVICLAVYDEPCTDLRGALVLNFCERRKKEVWCLALEKASWPLTSLWKPTLDRKKTDAEAIGESFNSSR